MKKEKMSKRAYEIIRNRMQALEAELYEYGMKFDDKDFIRAADFLADLKGDRAEMIEVINDNMRRD